MPDPSPTTRAFVLRKLHAVPERPRIIAGEAAHHLRSALDLPDDDPKDGRSVLVRLGASRGTPLTLGRITLLAKPGAPVVARAEARLCGPDADPNPLAIALHPKPTDPSSVSGRIAPVLAVRRATDDLCVRFFSP